MGSNRRQPSRGSIGPRSLLQDIFTGDYWFQRWPGGQPTLCNTAGGVFGPPLGATSSINCAMFRFGQAAYHVKGTQTILGPLDSGHSGIDGGGLVFSGDNNNGDGFEYRWGASPSGTQSPNENNPFRATIGTSKDLFYRTKFSFDGSAGTTFMGFRKDQAYAAALATYTDFAGFSFASAGGGANNINVATQTASGGVVTTATGLATTVSTTFEVMVRLQGRRVRFYVNEIEVLSGLNFNFTNGLAIQPMLFYIADGSSVSLMMKELELGYVQNVFDF